MESNGFVWTLKDYLSMGFDVGELCAIVNFRDGNDLYEQFIGMLMESKLHWKEKDCSDWMVQDPEDPALESIESLIIRAFASGSRNRKVDRYVPLEELRRILRGKLGAEYDVDALVDRFLQQEKELETVSEEERRQRDKSGELNRIMNKAHDDFEKMRRDYDIPIDNFLAFYKPGNTIEPKTERLLRKIIEFGDTLLEKEEFITLSTHSVMQRGTWLVSAGSQVFCGDLRDTDWEHIFTNLEKDPDSFARYYPLFCITQ